MPISSEEPMASREEILKSLNKRSVELFGPQRTEAIQATIEQTTGHIWNVSQNLPPEEEEPGFYF